MTICAAFLFENVMRNIQSCPKLTTEREASHSDRPFNMLGGVEFSREKTRFENESND